MTTRKNATRKNTKAISTPKQAASTLKSETSTWNSSVKAFQVGNNTQSGKRCLEALHVLHVNVEKLSCLTAKHIFDAWQPDLMRDGKPELFVSQGYTITLGGKSYRLHTLGKSGLYHSVQVFYKKTIVSATDKTFAKKVHVAPSPAIIADGLEQCSNYDAWCDKVLKAANKANAITEGYVNLGTSQKPMWTMVIRKDNHWLKATEAKKASKK